jgi:hypothetical protein
MKREAWLAMVGFGALALVACGSSTKEDFDDENAGGEAGDGGTTSGGTSNGGSSGASGSSTGGASGSSTGGSTTGGASGSSTGGASGSAGSAGMRGYRPPERQIQGCTQMCELEAAAMCAAEDTLEKCVEDCRVAIQFEACSAQWDALFACAGTASPAVCSSEGESVVADCVTEQTAAILCVIDVTNGSELASQCSAHCTAGAAAMCPSGDTVETCSFNCRVLSTGFPVCEDRLAPFLTCSAAAAEHTCDAAGEPQPTGCAGTLGTFVDCLTVEYGWNI